MREKSIEGTSRENGEIRHSQIRNAPVISVTVNENDIVQ